MTRALYWIVHLCRGLRLGNNPVKCSQVAQVLLCSLVMNQPAVTGISAVSRVTIQVWWRAAGNGAWRVQHSFAGTHTHTHKKMQMSVRRWCTHRQTELGLTLNPMHLQVKQQLVRFNTQTSSKLCLANLLHASSCFLYRSANKWKRASALLEFQPFPQSPTFLPVNVIEGKQSQPPNAATSQIRPIFITSYLCSLLC